MNSETTIPFGLRDNKLIHILELDKNERGLKCGCICPKCRTQLVARMGTKKRHYFAHNNKECKNALETALHLFAKEVFEKNKNILLPEIRFNKTIEYLDRYIEINKILFKKQVFSFDRVEVEKRLNGVIADVVLYKNDVPLIVEIRVTHEVDEKKLEKIKGLNISAIEILLNCADIDYYKFNREYVEDLIINKIDFKEWLMNVDVEKEKKRLVELAKTNIEKEINEEKKKEKLKQLEWRRKRQWLEKGLGENLTKIKLLTDEEYQSKEREKWRNKIQDDPIWKETSKYLKINLDNIPEYLNQEIEGDFIFKCDRRIWQSRLFATFIYDWKNKNKPNIFGVKGVLKWLQNSKYACMINQELDDIFRNLKYIEKIEKEKKITVINYVTLSDTYPELKKYLGYSDLTNVICDFFEGLVKYEMLETSYKTDNINYRGRCHPYYYQFYRTEDDLKYINKIDIERYKQSEILKKYSDYVHFFVIEYYLKQIKILKQNGYRLNLNYHWYKRVLESDFDDEIKFLNKLTKANIRYFRKS